MCVELKPHRTQSSVLVRVESKRIMNAEGEISFALYLGLGEMELDVHT